MSLRFWLLGKIILAFFLFNVEIVKSETNIIECYECETQSTDNIDEMKRDTCYTLAGNVLEFKKCLTSQQCSVREYIITVNSKNRFETNKNCSSLLISRSCLVPANFGLLLS